MGNLWIWSTDLFFSFYFYKTTLYILYIYMLRLEVWTVHLFLGSCPQKVNLFFKCCWCFDFNVIIFYGFISRLKKNTQWIHIWYTACLSDFGGRVYLSSDSGWIVVLTGAVGGFTACRIWPGSGSIDFVSCSMSMTSVSVWCDQCASNHSVDSIVIGSTVKESHKSK